MKTSNKYSKILVFKCSVNVLFYYHHKLYISLNWYKGLTTLKESLRAVKRPLENVIKTFAPNSVFVGAEKRINKKNGDKTGCDTSPKRGFLTFYWAQIKGQNIAFSPPSPHAMLCRCSSYLEIKTRNTSTLNGGEDGGVWILLFSEVTLFESNNFVDDRSLVFNLLTCYRHIEIISPLSEAFYYRLFIVQQIYF